MAAADFKDYYAVLGITKTANADEIKKTYRRLARKYHPDLNPGDRAAETRFKEINEAYEVLSDPGKRAKYDQFGRYWQQADRAGPAYGRAAAGGAGFDEVEFGRYGSFDEFINDLLGRFGGPGTPGAGAPRPGASGFGGFNANDFSGFGQTPRTGGVDREANLSLTLSEAFHGTEKRLTIGTETITVRIPPGAKAGSKIRVRGKGATDPTSRQRGDLYLKVNLQRHEFFEFEGDQLTCEVAIAPDEAALGAKIDVPTPDGPVTVNIPAGIRSGQSLRLRGKGWRKPDGSRGDQLVKVALTVPKTLTAAEREAYEKLRAARTNDPRAAIKAIQL